MKKILTFILLLTLMLMPNIVFATEINNEIANLDALKEAIKNKNVVGEFDIKISVPGNEIQIANGYNIIFVVDASTSTNNIKWPLMRQAIIDTVETVLPEDNSSKNTNMVGLITFGIGSHLNIGLTKDKSVFYKLPEKIGGDLLLPGRSATNNEVGLKGAYQYLSGNKIASTNGEFVTLEEELKKDKEHTYVIYLSDGNSNMSETPRNWYRLSSNKNEVTGEYQYHNYSTSLFTGEKKSDGNWKYISKSADLRTFQRLNLLSSMITYNLYKDSDGIVATSDYERMYQEVLPLYQAILGKNVPVTLIYEYYLYEQITPSTVVLGDSNNEVQSTINGKTVTYEEAQLEIIKNENINKLITKLDNCIEELYTIVYNLSGYDKNTAYSAGEYERMINIYKFSNNEAFEQEAENFFYYPLFKEGSDRVNNANRAVEMGNKLKEYATIYTIGFGNMTRADALKIMNPEYKGSGNYTTNSYETHFSSYYEKATSTNINKILKNLILDITKINYKNPVIVDYTSKWVNPIDINGDGIFDEKDITITKDGKVINNTIITVEKLTEEEIINSNDLEINGNTNGDIYRITWKITDYLNSLDKYVLNYKVKVDTQEYGFISNKDYAANGKTTLTYDVIKIKETDTDGDGIVEKNETFIRNDEINIKVPTVKQKQNIVVITKTDESGNLLNGADFDITSNEGINQIVKEYSVDGINWTTTNEFNNATYFRFSGLYDFKYIIKETITPNGYLTIEDLEYNFKNIEDKMIEDEIINRKKDLVPQTYNDVNYKKGLGMSLIGFTGLGIGGLMSHRKKRRKISK